MVLLPAEQWSRSNVTSKELEKLVADGLLSPITDSARPEWIVSDPDEVEPNPRPSYVVSFKAFHDHGFGMPPNRFMHALPHYYGVELHNLSPNSISQAAIFVAVCEGYLGIPPHWELWLHLFEAELFTKYVEKGTRRIARADGCTLQVHQDQQGEYIPAKLGTSNHGWHDGWFYLRNDGGLLPAYTGKVLDAQPDKWRYGVVRERQGLLQPLLAAVDGH